VECNCGMPKSQEVETRIVQDDITTDILTVFANCHVRRTSVMAVQLDFWRNTSTHIPATWRQCMNWKNLGDKYVECCHGLEMQFLRMEITYGVSRFLPTRPDFIYPVTSTAKTSYVWSVSNRHEINDTPLCNYKVFVCCYVLQKNE
jgi:hypothetical protein